MTEIKHEYGYWIVFVNDNPKFSFMYREEAKSVADMINALLKIYDQLNDVENNYQQVSSDSFEIIEQALKKIGYERT